MDNNMKLYWNKLHDQALGFLTSEYIRIGDLKKKMNINSIVPFDDLVVWGRAERHIEPLYHNGVASGCAISYKLSSKGA